MQRQHHVLSALWSRLLQIQNLGALPAVLQACQNLRSDVPSTELAALALAARSVPTDRIQLRAIDERMVQPTWTAAGASVLAPHWEMIKPLIRETLPRAQARQ
jgi:hypothetical protein